MASLGKLDVGFSQIGAPGVVSLLDSECLQGLEQFRIQDAALDDAALGRFKTAELMPGLRCLSIAVCDLADGFAAALAEFLQSRCVRDLDVDSCGLSDAALRQIAESPGLASAWRLCIGIYNLVGKSAMAGLAESTFASNLVELVIHHVACSEQTIASFVQSDNLKRLDTLWADKPILQAARKSPALRPVAREFVRHSLRTGR